MAENKCNGVYCKNAGMMACARCRTKYCSAECQKSHWGIHKLTCKQIAKLQTPIEQLSKSIKKKSNLKKTNKLDQLCLNNRESIIALSEKLLPGPWVIESKYNNRPLSDMRNDTQKELDDLLLRISEFEKKKFILDKEKIIYEDIVYHFTKHNLEKSEDCASYQKKIDKIESQISILDKNIILYNEMKCRMDILIRDIYTISRCIKCNGTRLKDNILYQCNRCKMAHYCSEKCGILDFADHQKSCK